MLVLAIDTSSPAVTAALVSTDGEVVAVRSELAPRGHGELLAPAVADCLAAAKLTPDAVDAVVAGVGPGPYTGLRVGLVSAAAFAHARGIPAYGVCSLDAIATQGEGDTIVVTDARRREVYWARYRHGSRVDGPHVAHPGDVPFDDDVAAVAGAGVDVYADAWPSHLARLPGHHPDPAALVALARDRVTGGADSEPLAPLYLRRPDAVVPGAPKQVSQR